MNAAMTAIMILLVVMGVLLLNLTSSENIKSAKDKADIARTNLQAKETLQVLSKLSIQTDLGTISLPEALDMYFQLKIQDDYDQRDLKNQLASQISIEINKLLETQVIINAEFYWRETLQENLVLYYNPVTIEDDFDYLESVILPSSYSRLADYYINVSIYKINNVRYKIPVAVPLI